MPDPIENAVSSFLHKYQGSLGIISVRPPFINAPQVIRVSTLRDVHEVTPYIPQQYMGFPVHVEHVARETPPVWLKLAPRTVKDARSGKDVRRGERVEEPDGHWWRWLD
jgi:hypothetical protein